MPFHVSGKNIILPFMIRMSDATWFKKIVFAMAMKIGRKRADLQMDFKPVPLSLELLYSNWPMLRSSESLKSDWALTGYAWLTPEQLPLRLKSFISFNPSG